MTDIREPTKDEYTRGGYFPLAYVIDFLELLVSYGDAIRIITYADLPWGQDVDHVGGYPQELAAWRQRVAASDGPHPIWVLLQHDVDSRPERTLEMLRHEERLGIPSNVMIFNRRVNRRHLSATGEVRFTDYLLDEAYLQRLERQGFVIGYHSNAFEQALWDEELAQRVFEADVSELRQRHRVEFFSPHGGTPGPGGINNGDMPLPESLKGSIRWVNNRYTPSGFRSFSDGGINSLKRDPKGRDLRDFVRTWKRGERYRVLLHPQYYSDPCAPSPRMMEADWYREMLGTYASGGSGWAGVEIRDLHDG